MFHAYIAVYRSLGKLAETDQILPAYAFRANSSIRSSNSVSSVTAFVAVWRLHGYELGSPSSSPFCPRRILASAFISNAGETEDHAVISMQVSTILSILVEPIFSHTSPDGLHQQTIGGIHIYRSAYISKGTLCPSHSV